MRRRGGEAGLAAMATIVTPLGPMTLGATERGLALARFDGAPDCASDDAAEDVRAVGGDGQAPATAPRWEAAADPGASSATGSPAAGPDAMLAAAVAAVESYFHGDGAIEALPPLDMKGTELQRAVWNELVRIPAGVTRTYTDIAVAVGRPRAVRAIGAAIGANPVGVLVPCHRVVGADGRLTGYAGGLDRKRWLLAHEGAALPL
ncbi:methylated-DNA--[protein]-cysteine S-methyltransferase [Demequina salsinemoris]|uniref:methylated-DNA--[protein]-cysteine S-methyltransferase n=1 Tax=Demequina salsinemoris TaxID=577470 RepID=UPI000780686E|nr:methylated-DNA--[protein]-cysteine S-methyltransferase [Demequina salsinemoris]